MKIKNKATGQWEQFYMAGYAAMPNYDTTVTETSSNAPTSAAVKNYVDTRTISYVDSGYYQTPTSWTIVTETPSSYIGGRLYLVCPDWMMKAVRVNCSGSVDSSINFESLTCVMQNPSDHTKQQSFNILLPTDWDTTEKKVPQYGCDMGLIPYFTKESSSTQAVTIYAVIEGRDSSTRLEDYAEINVANAENGVTYYFEASEHYPPVRYLSGDLSYSLTINVDGGGGQACLTGDTAIKTITGDKPIKDIRIGDAVLDAENRPVLVTKIYSHDTKTLYRTTFKNKDSFLATASHKIRTNHGVVHCFGLVKDLEVMRSDGSTFTVLAHETVNLIEPIKVYEIMTETGTYQLTNGVINESEEI